MKYRRYTLSAKRRCWLTLYSLGLATIHLSAIVIIKLVKTNMDFFVGYFILLLIVLSSILLEVCDNCAIGIKYMVPTYLLFMVATGPLLLAECGVKSKVWVYIVPISEIIVGIVGVIVVSVRDNYIKVKTKKRR